jgi:hypothetical protein
VTTDSSLVQLAAQDMPDIQSVFGVRTSSNWLPYVSILLHLKNEEQGIHPIKYTQPWMRWSESESPEKTNTNYLFMSDLRALSAAQTAGLSEW